ncbi:MAG: DUF447 family protein [Asgard group archaeon]|nr:DUF447 family protein [Asgard group archaeon]
MPVNDDLLQPNVIYETIITTYNEFDIPNAAPMGIFLNEQGLVVIRTYIPSDTFANLWEKGICIVNITSDPTLFTNCALFQEELTDEDFMELPDFEAPILTKCQASYFQVKIIKKTRDNEKAYFYGEISKRNLKPQKVNLYTRAFSSLLEILIHATRVLYCAKTKGKNSKEVKLYQQHIAHHTEIIKKVAKKETIYLNLLQKIQSKINFELGKL